MRLSYLDTVRDKLGNTLRVKVILDDDGEGGIYCAGVLDADGLAKRGPAESECGYDVRAILDRTCPEELRRIRSERHDRYAECLAQEAGLAADISWSKADEVTLSMCVEMDAAAELAYRPWRKRA